MPYGSNYPLTYKEACWIQFCVKVYNMWAKIFFLLAFACWHLNLLSITRKASYFHCGIETKLSWRKHHKRHKNGTFLMIQHDYPDLIFCCGFYWFFFLPFFFQNKVLTFMLFFDKIIKLCQRFEICHGTSLFARTSCKWCPPYLLKKAACLSISKYYSVVLWICHFFISAFVWTLLKY